MEPDECRRCRQSFLAEDLLYQQTIEAGADHTYFSVCQACWLIMLQWLCDQTTPEVPNV